MSPIPAPLRTQTARARCTRSRGRVGGLPVAHGGAVSQGVSAQTPLAKMSCPSSANWGALKLGHTLAACLHDGDRVYRVVGVTKRRVEVRRGSYMCVWSCRPALTACCPQLAVVDCGPAIPAWFKRCDPRLKGCTRCVPAPQWPVAPVTACHVQPRPHALAASHPPCDALPPRTAGLRAPRPRGWTASAPCAATNQHRLVARSGLASSSLAERRKLRDRPRCVHSEAPGMCYAPACLRAVWAACTRREDACSCLGWGALPPSSPPGATWTHASPSRASLTRRKGQGVTRTHATGRRRVRGGRLCARARGCVPTSSHLPLSLTRGTASPGSHCVCLACPVALGVTCVAPADSARRRGLWPHMRVLLTQTSLRAPGVFKCAAAEVLRRERRLMTTGHITRCVPAPAECRRVGLRKTASEDTCKAQVWWPAQRAAWLHLPRVAPPAATQSL
jgi:hypothetical protein